jgi:hypothetical protein
VPNFYIWIAEHLQMADQSAVIGITLRRSPSNSVGAGAGLSGEGTLVVARMALGFSQAGRHLASPQRGRLQGSTLLIHTTPAPTEGLFPLRFFHPLFVRLMRIGADKSAMGAVNRPLLYGRIILLKVITRLIRKSMLNCCLGIKCST